MHNTIRHPKYSTLMFDIDNTLWDFDTASYQSLQQLFADFRLEDSGLRWRKFLRVFEHENARLWHLYHQGLVDAQHVSVERFRATLAQLKGPEAVAPEMSARYFVYMDGQAALYPGALEVLEQLAGRYTMVLITNGFRQVQQQKVQSSGLAPYFEHLVTAEDAGALKPRPAIFELALSLAHSTPQQTLMVGDDYQADVLGARRLGIDQVWFTPNNYRPGQATYRIRQLVQLLSLVGL